MANIRAAYAEVSTEALTNTDSAVTPLYVTATQTQDKWKNNNNSTTTDIGGIQVEVAYNAKDAAKKCWKIAYNSADGKVTITPEASIPTGATAYPSSN